MPNLMTENDSRDEELVIVETPPGAAAPADDADPSADTPKPAENATDEDEDDRAKASAEGDDDFTEDEREAIRERRRLEKAERKERREKAISRDKLELDFLRKRNDALERRLSGVEQKTHTAELSNLDAQIARARNDAEMAERVIAKAVEVGNGADVAQALKLRDQAIQTVHQLSTAKQQAEQRPSAVDTPALDDLTAHYAGEFLRENKWYDPQGRDEDSAIMLAIDNGLVRDGYNPQTPEYWDELRSRAARRLPERFNAARSAPERREERREERAPRGGPAVGSGREHAPATTRREVYISPERKAALIEAGVWDDPVLRMKYVKRYSEYDRQNRA